MFQVKAVLWLLILGFYECEKVHCALNDNVSRGGVVVSEIDLTPDMDSPVIGKPWWNETLTIPEGMLFKEKLLYFETLVCPVNSLCDPIQPLHRYPCSPFWCYGCSCETCKSTRDCCLDSSLQGREDEWHSDKLTTCLPSTLKYSEEIKEMSYHFVNTCPNYFRDFQIKAKCEYNEYDLDEVLQFIPVYSTTTQLNYINQFCAQCNKETEALVFWTPQINCGPSVDIGNATTKHEILQIAWREWACSFASLPPDEAVYIPCNSSRRVIHTCNETGLWKQTDEDIVMACHRYKSVVYSGLMAKWYRNIFCAICNGLTVQNIVQLFNEDFLCAKKPTDGRQLGSGVSFSVLFNLNRDDKEQKIQVNSDSVKECKETQIYDPYSNWCRPIHCTRGRVVENHSCVNAFTSSKHIAYKTLYWVFPERNWCYTVAQFRHLWDTYMIDIVLKNFKKYLNIKLAYHSVEFYICYDDKLSNSTVRVSHLEIMNKMAVESEMPPEFTENLISGFLNHKWNYSEVLWVPKIQNRFPDSYCQTLHSYKENFIYSNPENVIYFPDESSGLIIPLTGLTNCIFVELNGTEYKLNPDTGELQLILAKEIIQSDEYLMVGDKVRICVNFSGYYDVKQAQASQGRVENGADSVEVLLTFIFQLLSIFFLFATVLISLIINNVRTTPGKVTFVLILSLLIAQTLYFVSGYPLGYLWPCRIMGLAVHLNWLIVFAWKNVAAFHMYAVFTRPIYMAAASQTRLFLLYSLYGFVVPVLLVGSYVLAQTLLSGTESIGYGDETCFLSRPLDTGLAFMVPVALVIVTNTFFFVRTVRAIRAMSAIELLKSSNRKNTSHNTLFMKMSIMLGFTWIVGFLANIIKINYIWYAFIILNGGIGVLVFANQVCNRQVLVLLQIQLCSRKGNVFRSTTVPTLSRVSDKKPKAGGLETE